MTVTDASFHRYNKYLLNIKDYEIVTQLDSGGFGVVYSVKNKKSNETFAAKVLVNHANDNNYKKMVNREIGILIRCQNPTVIKFLGYSLEDFNKQRNVTIFMDHAANGSLKDLLSKARSGSADHNYDFTAQQIILCGIAYGMMYLHRRNIIHRDLKPGNVLLDEKLHPMITDFGLSKLYETGNSNQSIQCGTSVYMAPEVIQGVKYNEKADVYSFGILMYEIVTSSIPYPEYEKGNLNPEQFKKRVTQENYRPEFNVKVKPSIKRLIQRCWASDPEERPSFEVLFKMLAYNEDDPNEDSFYRNEDDEMEDYTDQKKYYLDDADADEVLIYAEDIDQSQSEILSTELLNMKKMLEDQINLIKEENNSMKKEIADLKEENEKIKKQLTNMENVLKGVGLDQISIRLFNSSPLHFKLTMIKNLSNTKMIHYFTRINSLLQYFEELKQDSSHTYIEIISNNQEQSLNDINEEEQVQINYDATNILYIYRSFELLDFCNLLNQFTNILIEIKYPSENYKETYQNVLQIKKRFPNKIGIGIYYSQLNKSDCEFAGNNEISSVRFDPSIEQIIGKDGLFKSCQEIRRVLIPPSVKFIGNSSFDECLSISHITIPLSVKAINDFAFKCCKRLETINIPPSVIDIGEGCFCHCIKLTHISIPYSIKEIKFRTFLGCKSLKHVDISRSLRRINNQAFDGCVSLNEIKVPFGIYISRNSFPEETKIIYFK